MSHDPKNQGGITTIGGMVANDYGEVQMRDKEDVPDWMKIKQRRRGWTQGAAASRSPFRTRTAKATRSTPRSRGRRADDAHPGLPRGRRAVMSHDRARSRTRAASGKARRRYSSATTPALRLRARLPRGSDARSG